MPGRDNDGPAGRTPTRTISGFIEPIEIQEEMERSFLEYSMSVIVSRALPDVRDGLKPVHRRILYSMYDQRLLPDRPHTKCAKVVGDVMGSYHPHGDSSIYEALARMVQEFSMRHPLIDGHGNFGGTGPDEGPAAMRYTECRLGSLALELMSGIDQETVDFARQLRRHLRRADGPARPVPQHAGQRLPGHRRGHGHQHPAPQPGRGHRRHHPPARAPRRHPGRPDGVRQGPRLPDRRAHPRSPGDPGRPPHRAGARSRCGPWPRSKRAGPARPGSWSPRCPTRRRSPRSRRRSRTWSGPGDLDGIAEAQDDSSGGQDPSGHPAQARRQRQRGPQQPVQADADADHLQRQRGGPGRRGAPHAQPGPDADPLRGPPGRGGHPPVAVPAGQGPGPGPRGRGPAQGHRHARRGHRRHPGLGRPAGRARGPAGRALRLLRGAGQPHPRHDPVPAHPAGPDQPRRGAGQAAGGDRRAGVDPQRPGQAAGRHRHRAGGDPREVRQRPAARSSPTTPAT